MGRGGMRLSEAPGLDRSPFYIKKNVVNKENINERIEVFILMTQKSLSRKNESLTNTDVTISTKRIDFKSPFLAGDLKPYR